jgi:hypothetical protein
MWHVDETARGVNGVGSCLYKYLMNLCPDIRHIIMYLSIFQGQYSIALIHWLMSMLTLKDCPSLQSVKGKGLPVLFVTEHHVMKAYGEVEV